MSIDTSHGTTDGDTHGTTDDETNGETRGTTDDETRGATAGTHDDPPRSSADESARRSDVHVIGGGLGGLAAAAVVARAGHTVTVHERRNRLGGRATTDERSGYRFNQGPHAFYRGGPGAEVLQRLGIRPRGTSPKTTNAMMARDGRLFVAPGSTGTLARTRLLGTRDKVALAAALARLPKIDTATLAGLTATEWIDGLVERPSVREVIHSIVRLTSYVDGPDHLSAEVAASQVRMGLGDGVLYLDRGWQQLVDALAATAGVTIASGEPVADLDDLAARIDGPVGGHDGAPVIVAAGGPSVASRITGHPYDPGHEATAAVLDLGLTGESARPFVIGIDDAIYLSNHGLSEGMVPDGRASVSLAAYHRVGAGAPTGNDGRPVDRARLRAFAALCGITDEQVVEERYLHRMTVVSSIATAAAGGLAGRPGVAVPDQPGVYVSGDWVGRRGHLADAVLASAEEAATAAVAQLARKATVR